MSEDCERKPMEDDFTSSSTEKYTQCFMRQRKSIAVYKMATANPIRATVSASVHPQSYERMRGKHKSFPNLYTPDSPQLYKAVINSSDRKQGPRFKSTLYRTSSPGPGESIVRLNKLVIPNVGRREMRAVAIKTFDIDQGHFLVYVRADCKRHQISKSGLKPVIDMVTVGKVKQLAGKYLNLLPDSLNMFGLFAGELGKPCMLYQDTDALPDEIDQFCFQRLNFISNKEIAITDRDSRAMELVFWEVKNIFENGKVWPMMKQPQWKKLFDVSAECQKEWITKSVIPFHIMKKFIETLRSTIPLFYWSCYYWCHGVLQSRLKGREKGTEVIVIPDIKELLIYDTTLGKKFVSWPWSKIVSIKLKADGMKLIVFDVLIKENDKCDIIRDLVIFSDQCQYIFTIAVHIINLLEELRARCCHYPLGILWTKNIRVPKLQNGFYKFYNVTLCEPAGSLLDTDYFTAEVFKECSHGDSNPPVTVKEDKPLYYLQSISILGAPEVPKKTYFSQENIIFKLSLPKDCMREITVMHYFDAQPVQLTVVVTPKGDSRLKVYQIRKEVGLILGITDEKGISIFGLFTDKELLEDNMLLPLSNSSPQRMFWFKRLSFNSLTEEYVTDKEECILKALFAETYQIITNDLNRPAISPNHFSTLLSKVSSGNKSDSKPTAHQKGEFMKYVHTYIPFYWQSFYGASGTVSENSAIPSLTSGIKAHLAINIHKLEILSNDSDSKQMGSWLWVQIHSVERSTLDSITFKGMYGKQKQLVSLTFQTSQRDYLFSIIVHIFKLLEEKYKIVTLSRKEPFVSDQFDAIFNNAFFLSDSKLLHS